MSEVTSRDTLIEGAKDSPAEYHNMAKYADVAFFSDNGTAITKVEVANDDTNYRDITANTALLDLTVAGLAVLKNVAFKSYRVTCSGQKIAVNAN